MTFQTALNALFASGHAIDFVLAVVAAEFAVSLLVLGGRKTRLDMLFALLPGVFLLLALRTALTGGGVVWVAAFLTASFPIHLIDLVRRRVWSRHAP